MAGTPQAQGAGNVGISGVQHCLPLPLGGRAVLAILRYQPAGGPWFIPLILAAFILLPLAGLAVLLPWLCAARCTVYAVTNRRAIALTRILFRYWLNAWNVQDYLFIKRGKNGSGDIIYEQERYGASAYLEGLRGLADVDAVAALIEKAGGSECTKVEKAHEHAA